MSTSRLAPGRAAARLTLPLADLIALTCAAAITGPWSWQATVYPAAAWAALAGSGLHRLRTGLRVSGQAIRVAATVAVSVGCVLVWTPVGRAARLGLLAAGLVLACRAVALAGLRAAHRRGWLTQAVLLVGVDETARLLAGRLRADHRLGLQPAGFLAEDPDAAGPSLPIPGPDASGLPVLGKSADLSAVVARYRISRVFVCVGVVPGEGLPSVLRACRALRADVCVVPRLSGVGPAVPRWSVDEVAGIPLLSLRGPRRLAARLALKRVFDLVAAVLLLALTLPLLAALALVSGLDLRRPPLFRQLRVVGSGRLAEIVKLRTLAVDGEPDTCWAPCRRQCTWFGWILRSSHLDELPQLVNVLRGEMSLVGPRPERPHFARQFAREIPGYSDRQRMPAGITGWAQVHGLNGDTSIRDRVRFDNAYIDCWSFWLDLVIVVRTAIGVVSGVFREAAGTPAVRETPAGTPAAVPAPPEVLPSPVHLAPGLADGSRR